MRSGGRLLGRVAERHLLDALLASARKGKSAAVVIRGEAGVGKTTLLDYACDAADGMLVLRARGVDFESELAFSTLFELLRPVLDQLDVLADEQAKALRAAFAAVDGEGTVNRLSAYSATLNLVAAVAEHVPVLCAVDDAHLIDRASAEALLFTARRLLAERVVMIFAARDVPGFDAPGLPDLPVGGIDQATGIRLATQGGMSREAAMRLVTVTAGNPLALIELPATLTPAQRQGKAPLEHPLPVASRVEAAFLSQARALTDTSWRALVMCAVCDSGGEEVLARGLDVAGQTLEALDPAVAAGLLTMRHGEIRFRHPLVRSAVYSAAGPGLRRSAHLAFAQALTSADEADRRAWHLAAAATGPDENVAAALAEAAERAMRRGGVMAMARTWERSARLTADPEIRAERLVGAMRAWLASGESEHAVALAEEVLTTTTRSDLRCSAQSTRAYTALQRGDLSAVSDEFLAEAESYAAADPIGAAKMMSSAVNHCWSRLDIAGMVRLCTRVAELITPHNTRGSASARLAAAQVLAGMPEGGELAYTCIPECARLPATGTASEVAEILVWLEDYDRARPLLESDVAAARRREDVSLQAYALNRLAGLECRVGQLHAAHKAAAEAVQIAEQIGLPSQRAYALTMLALVEALLGNHIACQEHADLIRRIGPAGYLDIEARTQYALGISAMQQGRYQNAADHLEWIDNTLQRAGLVEPGWLPIAGDLAETYLHLAQEEQALKVIYRLEAAADTGRMAPRAAAARCRALLAPQDDMDKAFTHALEVCESTGSALDPARTLLVYGQRLRRAKRRRDARQRLEAALTLFDTAGAAGWAAQCRSELRATGLKTTAPARHSEARLTTQEWQIALHAAEGLTNKEIAARVFLSSKTVDYHLGNTYRKLGMHSRHELISYLSHTNPQSPEH